MKTALIIEFPRPEVRRKSVLTRRFGADATARVIWLLQR